MSINDSAIDIEMTDAMDVDIVHESFCDSGIDVTMVDAGPLCESFAKLKISCIADDIAMGESSVNPGTAERATVTVGWSRGRRPARCTVPFGDRELDPWEFYPELDFPDSARKITADYISQRNAAEISALERRATRHRFDSTPTLEDRVRHVRNCFLGLQTSYTAPRYPTPSPSKHVEQPVCKLPDPGEEALAFWVRPSPPSPTPAPRAHTRHNREPRRPRSEALAVKWGTTPFARRLATLAD